MTLDRRLARLLFALLVALPVSARAETDEVPPLPDRKPAHVEEPVAEAPVLPGDQPTVPWSDAEIAAAKTACDAALKDVAIDYQPLPPIKEGICGTPAPILVKSIGSDPAVAIDPPATMNCALAAGLAKWIRMKVQPEAMAALNTKVVKLRNATSYSCRNRYGSATTPLSEHALANALDVSDFVFASGDHITVLDGWPRLASATPPASTPSAEPATPPKENRAASVTRSILKVSQAIVDRQRMFFEHGDVAMRPLTLKEIAEAVELHESTISRVTTQKYMMTPRGLYEFKHFFGSSLATDEGGATSSTAMRALIKQLIDAENHARPLSDNDIADLLGKQGFVVARRTVAKYREQINIPPANQRKSL